MISIVIVSYNNISNLKTCITSIYKYHKNLDFEIIVVAYLFSTENLTKLKTLFPNIKIVESNEIRGFSENNNLGLKYAVGEYILILNDDTCFTDNSIELLKNTFSSKKDAVIVSPILFFPDGRIQFKGRNKFTLITLVCYEFQLKKISDYFSQYSRKKGIYPTYNVSGACFLIKTDIFKAMGYFNEEYFFTPEDVELSTRINKETNFKCYLNAEATVIHNCYTTAGSIVEAIIPTIYQGIFIFFRRNYGVWHEWCARLICCSISILKVINLKLSRKTISSNRLKGYINAIKFSFQKRKPKDIFIGIFQSIKKTDNQHLGDN